MLIVQGVLVSDDIIESNFCCDLTECEGMCCIEGDVGAPVDPLEVGDLEDYYPIFKKYMTSEGIQKVEQDGTFDYDIEGSFVTPLLQNEACVYVYFEEGVAKCAIEKAFLNDEIDFQKPISCHLYPIRIIQLPDYEALNYHRWIVCESACRNGKELNVPLYRFLKEPLIRKYGEIWYHELLKSIENQTL